jgi:pyruvate ferredoxin oxidoreductase gamma subunit
MIDFGARTGGMSFALNTLRIRVKDEGRIVVRIRFHGRGGHGIKTASRIAGSAAFEAGMQVQDSPVYGAERRGAAIAALTRIDTQPILERGMISDPDFIVVADETLLTESEAGVLVGHEFASAVFVNSPGNSRALANQFHIPCRVLTLDLTAQAIELLGRGLALSAAVAAAACAMTGFISLDATCRAVRLELAELHVQPDLIERNVELTRRVFAGVSAVPMCARPVAPVPDCIHEVTALGTCESVPIIYAVGNSAARHTGYWRLFRPVIDLEACTRCGICYALCPDSAITLNEQGFPHIDNENCKGCMMCFQECPVHCIREQREVRAW